MVSETWLAWELLHAAASLSPSCTCETKSHTLSCPLIFELKLDTWWSTLCLSSGVKSISRFCPST